MIIKVHRLDPSATLPTRRHSDDSGLDLTSLETVTLANGARHTFRLGIAVELPPTSSLVDGWCAEVEIGWEAQIRSRSSLTVRGVVACSGIGTVDNGYRGELAVVLLNLSGGSFTVEAGDRIAQLVVAPVVYPRVVEVFALSETDRGAAGFGSTGK